MADTGVDEIEESEPVEGEEAPGGRKRIVIIGLATVGLAIGAATGAMFIGPKVFPKPAPNSAATDTAAKEHGAEDGKPVAAPAVLTLSDLVLNPAGTGGSRFLLLTIALECADAKTLEVMQARDAELRDIILSTLGDRTVEQLTDITLREKIKADISGAIAERFGKSSLKRLYFPQFVVQ